MSIFYNNSSPSIKTLLSLTQLLAQMRHASVANSKKFKTLKAMQTRMQCDDGVPIYLKKGTPDKILHYFNGLLMVFGGLEAVRFLWRAMKK